MQIGWGQTGCVYKEFLSYQKGTALQTWGRSRHNTDKVWRYSVSCTETHFQLRFSSIMGCLPCMGMAQKWSHAFGHRNKHSKYIIHSFISLNNNVLHMSGSIWFECRCVTEEKYNHFPAFQLIPNFWKMNEHELITTRSWILPRWHWIILYGYSPKSSWNSLNFQEPWRNLFSFISNWDNNCHWGSLCWFSQYIPGARKVLQVLMQTLLPLHLVASCGYPKKSFPNGFQ